MCPVQNMVMSIMSIIDKEYSLVIFWFCGLNSETERELNVVFSQCRKNSWGIYLNSVPSRAGYFRKGRSLMKDRTIRLLDS